MHLEFRTRHPGSRIASLSVVSLLLLSISGLVATSSEQGTYGSVERGMVRDMLMNIKSDVRKHYYDPTFHGIDLDKNFRDAEEKLQKATSLNQAFGVIAQTLVAFDDSHLFFLPPGRPYRLEYGYRLAMVGDRCFVIVVRPGTDPSEKLHPGDEVLTIRGIRPTRNMFWQIGYYFNALSPQPEIEFSLRAPDGTTRQVTVKAKIQEHKKVWDFVGVDASIDINRYLRQAEDRRWVRRLRHVEPNESITIWRVPDFGRPESEMDQIFRAAHNRNALILDLRGNPGGLIRTLEYVLGFVVDHDVKIADRVGRKKLDPQLAKPLPGRLFKGKLIVLIDSESASAAELLARVVQLEKLGIVIGDRSAGEVMEARGYSYQSGVDTVVIYGCSITDADLIMTDGKSLEHTGVVPDEIVLPTAADLAARRDPVIARAAELAGFKITPEEAGKLFPVEWYTGE